MLNANETVHRVSSVPGRSTLLLPTPSDEYGIGSRAENRVIINVGGVKYETFKSTLKSIPDTRLSWITETTAQNSDYEPDTKEYFFDRHPGVFNMILNYYRTGKLHAPVDVCGPLFEEELAFWGIDEKQIEACCWMTYRTHRDVEETLEQMDGYGDTIEDDDGDDVGNTAERFGILEDDRPRRGCWETYRPRMWALLEEPYSCKAAQIMAAISMMFVMLSISIFTFESHIKFRHLYNSSHVINESWTVADINRLTYPEPTLHYIDCVCIAYFTIEFITRLIFCPQKLGFFKNLLNWVDLLAVIPFYIQIGVEKNDLQNSSVAQLFGTLRFVRIFRIFKLTRHFSGLKILGHTIKASAKEMALLIMFLVIFILIFACLVYLAEQVEEHPLNFFKSIPIGMWWACVTMTTLGYGDIYPRTALGYVVGMVCAVGGVLVLALPVPVIVNNFALYYSHSQARAKLPKKQRRNLIGAPDMLKTQAGMPGEGLAESGRVITRTNSRKTLASNGRGSSKGSTNSVNTNDSGVNTNKSNGSSSSNGVISVVFTDETRISDSDKNISNMPQEDSPATHHESLLYVRPDSGGSRRPFVQRDSHTVHSGVQLSVLTLEDCTHRRRSQTRKDGFNSNSKSLLSLIPEEPGQSRRNSLMPSMADVEM